MKMKGKNVFSSYLTLLDVRHTEAFSEQTFNEHPHKYNLFGFSKMLSDYGVKSVAIEVPDKEMNITEIQTPFIAQFSSDFVAVSQVESDKVSFIWNGALHDLTVKKFAESWTGIVLLTETSENSGEPDYKEHRKGELLNLSKRIILFAACGLIAVLAYIYSIYNAGVGMSLLLAVNLAGLYISWLLLLKQMRIQSAYADRICSLFKQKDCNNVLESKAAKLFGIIGWSEIGFGYFLANVLLLLFYPALITAIALLNILTLPFTVWSVWYQWRKAGQWCMLCLIVVALLWIIFIVNSLFGYLQFSSIIALLSLSVAEVNEAIYFHLFYTPVEKATLLRNERLRFNHPFWESRKQAEDNRLQQPLLQSLRKDA